jgi:hypothetical protein
MSVRPRRVWTKKGYRKRMELAKKHEQEGTQAYGDKKWGALPADVCQARVSLLRSGFFYHCQNTESMKMGKWHAQGEKKERLTGRMCDTCDACCVSSWGDVLVCAKSFFLFCVFFAVYMSLVCARVWRMWLMVTMSKYIKRVHYSDRICDAMLRWTDSINSFTRALDALGQEQALSTSAVRIRSNRASALHARGYVHSCVLLSYHSLQKYNWCNRSTIGATARRIVWLLASRTRVRCILWCSCDGIYFYYYVHLYFLAKQQGLLMCVYASVVSNTWLYISR